MSPRAVTPSRLAVGALLLAVALPPAWLEGLPPLCLFRSATGLPCPGCGLTRSVVAAMHGDLAQSLVFHPLGPVVAIALLASVVAALPRARAATSRDDGGMGGRDRVGRLRATWAGGWLPWASGAALLVVWAVRLPLFVAGLWVY